MKTSYIFESERLGFRNWKESDRILFRVMTADPEVMQFFPKLLRKEESDQLINRFKAHMDDKGFAMWAVERKEDEAFIGFIGLLEITMAIEGQGSAEIGWRLDKLPETGLCSRRGTRLYSVCIWTTGYGSGLLVHFDYQPSFRNSHVEDWNG